MKVSRDVVAQSEPLSDELPRAESEDAPQDQGREQHAKQDGDASEPLQLSLDQLLAAKGRVRLEGSLIIEPPQKTEAVPRLHLITTETAFHFHKLAEMQLAAAPSNENFTPNERNSVTEVIENYQYHQKAIKNNNLSSRPPVI